MSISETCSEKRRGRPKSAPELPPAVLTMFPDVLTSRGRTNLAYRQVAISALITLWEGGDRSCARLLDVDAATSGGFKLQSGVLVELGRLMWERGESTGIAFAKALCDSNLDPRTAVARLKAVRTGAKPGSSAELTDVLLHAANDYLRRRPMSMEAVATAVAQLQTLVAASLAAGDTEDSR